MLSKTGGQIVDKWVDGMAWRVDGERWVDGWVGVVGQMGN